MFISALPAAYAICMPGAHEGKRRAFSGCLRTWVPDRCEPSWILGKAFNWVLAYTFRGLVHYHGREHGGRQAWCWRSHWELHPDPISRGRVEPAHTWHGLFKFPNPPQWHTSSNDITPTSPPNPFKQLYSVVWWLSIQIWEPVGAILIETTTVH